MTFVEVDVQLSEDEVGIEDVDGCDDHGKALISPMSGKKLIKKSENKVLQR